MFCRRKTAALHVKLARIAMPGCLSGSQSRRKKVERGERQKEEGRGGGEIAKLVVPLPARRAGDESMHMYLLIQFLNEPRVHKS